MGSVLEGSSMGSVGEGSGKVQIRNTYRISFIGVDLTTVQSYLSARSFNGEATPLPNQGHRKDLGRFIHGVHVVSFWEDSNCKHLHPVGVEHKGV